MEPDNIERYDRQIRLWGPHGQNKCSNSKICLINANSLGTEVLKGLCLAGIGSFTILDSQKLSPEDVECNFISPKYIGSSRAEAAKIMLLDLNDEVSGEVFPLEDYLPHSAHKKRDTDTVDDSKDVLNFWRQFNCVVASGFLYTDQITKLSSICWKVNVPLILCKSIGFFGSMRNQIKEHLIVESHPDNFLPDFNLDKPFNDLKEYFDSISLDLDCDVEKISSYPYIVIVYKYLKKWQNKNGLADDKLPGNHIEKKNLKSLIEEGLKTIKERKKDLRKNNADDQEIPFENYLEAMKAVNSCLTVSGNLPASVETLFSHSKVTTSLVKNLPRFWLIIRAVKEFVSKNGGRLPVSGEIPDMISSSDEYIRLQSIFTKKTREDVNSVFEIVQNLINSSTSSPGSSLYDETKLICKNIRDIKVVCTDPIFEEYDFRACTFREDDDEDEFITIDLCLKSVDVFLTTYGRLPGCQDDQVETDISKLRDCMRQMLGKLSNRLKTLDQCLYEISRYGGSELHATSAFIGGCIAQEVIKLITNQYVPVDNTLIYNAIVASTKSFKFSDAFTKL